MPSDKQPSRTSEHRRSNKPIMEKKRRARINNCLNELKNLLLEAMRKDPARHSKLEKADILEMTVKHLQNLQRQQMALRTAADPGVMTKYRAGYTECAQEVSRYMGALGGLGTPVKQRLLDHLANCVNGLGTTSGSTSTGSPMQLLPKEEIALMLPDQAMINANWPLNKQRFVSIYNNNHNNNKSNNASCSSLLTVNVGYNNSMVSSPSPNFGRCDSRSSLSPAMSDYSDTCSKFHDSYPCSSDLSSHYEPETTWPRNAFGHSLSDERSVLAYRSAIDQHPFEMRCGSSSPTSSHERLTPPEVAVDRCPVKHPHGQHELLVPVNLSKDADKMWRPW